MADEIDEGTDGFVEVEGEVGISDFCNLYILIS